MNKPRLSNNVFLSALLSALLATPLIAQNSLGSLHRSEVEDRVKLSGTLDPRLDSASDKGRAEPSVIIHDLVLNTRLTSEQNASLDALVAAQLQPSSASYHKWITRDQYAARFGLSPIDLAAICQWLSFQGLTVEHVGLSRNAIRISGSVSQLESAFHTEIHRFSSVGNMIRYSNVQELSVPSAVSSLIASVGGLQAPLSAPRHTLHPTNARSSLLTPQNRPLFTTATTVGNHFLTPGDLGVIYGINSLYTLPPNGYTGSGQQMAVIGGSSLLIDDVSAFRSAAGLPTTTVYTECISTSVPCSGNSAISQEYLQEADIDVEWAGAIAPNVTINYIYTAANDPTLNETNALQYAVQEYTTGGKVVPIISYSFGLCEQQWAASLISTFETVFKQAAAQGQTIIAAAGDSGSAACDASPGVAIPAASHGLAVSYPASSSYVLAVGGTEFTADGLPGQSDTSAYWNSTNSINASTNMVYSATGYIPEAVWNDSTYSISNAGGILAAGGGYSILFSRPTWQGLNPSPFVKNSGPRDVPDIAMAASSEHDPYLFCTQMLTLNSDNTVAATNGSLCQNGFYGANGDIYPVGGTSVVAPVVAGIFSLIEQATGETYGVIASALYKIAANSAAYQTNGSGSFNTMLPTLGAGANDNDVPCEVGSPNCGSNAQLASSSDGLAYGDAAGAPAYSLAVGLGSVNAFMLEQAMALMTLPTSTESFSLAGTAATVSNSGTTTTAINITPMNGYTGTIDLSCAVTASPTGAVDLPTCSVTNTAVISGSTVANATLTVATGSNTADNTIPANPRARRSAWQLSEAGCAFGLLVFFVVPNWKRTWQHILMLVFVVQLAGIMGCGGSSGSSSGSPSQPTSSATTTAGSYVVTVTGVDSKSATISSSVKVNLTVQ